MVNLDEKIQVQRDKIKKGGWTKYWSYFVLAALVAIGLAVTVFRDYLLRKRLAKAKTDAAIAKEALIQDEVNDKLEDLDKANKAEQDKINVSQERDRHLQAKHDMLADAYAKNVNIIDSLEEWDDIERQVRWADEDNSK